MTDFDVSHQALQSFRQHQGRIIETTVRRVMEDPEHIAHHGDQAEELVRSGLQFTTRMLDAALAAGESTLMEQQLQWAQSRLPHDGVSPEEMLQNLQTYRDVIQETLDAAHADEIAGAVDWMIATHQELSNE